MTGETLRDPEHEILRSVNPISHVGFYNLTMANSAGSLDRAVASISSPDDALNFAAGLADQAEADGGPDHQFSGASARAVIGASVDRTTGGSQDRKKIWSDALEYVVFGKETRGMWKALTEGRDFNAGGEHDRVWHSEATFAEASLAFKRASSRLIELSGQ